MKHGRLTASIGALLSTALILTGCALVQVPDGWLPIRPGFEPPTVWADATLSEVTDRTSIVDDPVEVELAANGEAILTEFPDGSWGSDQYGTCYEGDVSSRYSGEAEWRMVRRGLVELTYGESVGYVAVDLTLMSDGWSVLLVGACDKDQYWTIPISCGQLVGEENPNLSRCQD